MSWYIVPWMGTISNTSLSPQSPMTHAERIARHLGRKPDIARSLFVAANATVNGDVVLGPLSSVFYGAVLRGDIHEIRVGEGTNIQDNAIVHLADDYGA